MIDFLVRARQRALRFFLISLIVTAVAAPLGVGAQQPPVPPAVQPLKLAPPTLLQPLRRAEPDAAGEEPPPAVRRKPVVSTSIQVDSLHAVDPDSAGTLSASNGGFGVAMWEGTSRVLVDALLPRLPVNTASPAMRDLMRRLLLSDAAAPRGKGKTGSLIALRARLLAGMGDLAAVDDLMAVIPQRGGNEGLARVEADARLLANDNARACTLAAAQIGEHDSPYWQKAFNFCRALAGEHDRAALGVALMRELGEDDPVYFSLMDILSGAGAPPIDSLLEPTPLHLAMARAAKAALPADVIASNRPAVLRTIAISPNVAAGLRLEAAERAQAAKALSVDALRQLYTSIPFTDEELANPLSAAETKSGPMSRALLYRTALAQTVPTAQAEVLLRALELAREGGLYASTVRAFMPVLVRIPPSTEQVWFAPEAVQALLVSGEYDLVRSWFALLRTSAMFHPESAEALAGILPLARLAGSVEAAEWNTEKLAEWWMQVGQGEGARDRAALFYSLFEGLGETVPTALWEALMEGPERNMVAMPHAALWHRLKVAAAGKRVGETVLLALLALGQGGPSEAEPVVLMDVLGGLAGVGLTADARLLAVEAAVAAGL